MKTKLMALTSLILASQAHAAEIKSSDLTAQVNVARVIQVIPLVSKPNIRVSVAVRDLGGSTDFSPTQQAYLTLYSKGEMFSTDATFDLGYVYAVKSAKRVSGGKYSVVVSVLTDGAKLVDRTLLIDATKAVNEIQAVRCDDFDCNASEDFESTIHVEAN